MHRVKKSVLLTVKGAIQTAMAFTKNVIDMVIRERF
jgi:hypothetical protein